MEEFLASDGYTRAMEVLEADEDAKAAIFGTNWQPTWGQNLEVLRRIVTTVQRTMFCGSNHIFCVCVTPTLREVHDPPCWVPKQPLSGCEWTFELPEGKEVRVHVRTLLWACTSPLFFFWREIQWDTVRKGIEPPDRPTCVVGTHSNECVMKFGKLVELADALRIPSVTADILSLKDKDGRDIFRMTFHTPLYKAGVEWQPPSPVNDAGRWPSKVHAATEETTRLCKLLAALKK
jgi:hypothetical protein